MYGVSKYVSKWFADVNVVNRVPHGGVMVWAGISYGQRTQMHFIYGNLTVQRNHDEILRPVVVTFIRIQLLMLQHDNAQPHVTKICTQFLEAENVPVLPWPAYSPDMFGMLWIDLYDSMFQFAPISSITAIEEDWDNVPQATINSLINSMRKRCCAA